MKKYQIWIIRITLFIICTTSYRAFAQQPVRHAVGVKPVFGTHLLDDEERFMADRIYGLDLNYSFDLRYREEDWVNMLRAREFSVGFVMRDFSNLKGTGGMAGHSFGQSYGLVAQLDFHLFDAGPVGVYLAPALGLSYLTETFFTDPENVFIGSHLNQTIKAELTAEIPLSSKFSLLAGTQFLHHSNGGFNIPNRGLNTGNVFLGVKSGFETEAPERPRTPFRHLNRGSAEIAAGIGRRGVFQQHKGMAKSGLYAGYNYYLNEVFDLKAGLDAVYYFTVYDPDNRGDTYQHYGTSYKSWRAGISLGTDLKLGRWVVSGLYGKYLYYDSEHDIQWYWNAGLKYFITPRVGIQTMLYMHRAQADFVNNGLVVKL